MKINHQIDRSTRESPGLSALKTDRRELPGYRLWRVAGGHNLVRRPESVTGGGISIGPGSPKDPDSGHCRRGENSNRSGPVGGGPLRPGGSHRQDAGRRPLRRFLYGGSGSREHSVGLQRRGTDLAAKTSGLVAVLRPEPWRGTRRAGSFSTIGGHCEATRSGS